MQTHIYIYAWFCALHSAKPTKVQEEKADMLAKLWLLGISIDSVI